MAIIGFTLIAIYIITLVLVVMWPTRHHHPEDGMAIGLLMMAVAILVLLGLALALAAWFDARKVVYAITVMTAFPAVLFIPQLAWHGVKNLRNRAIGRGQKLSPDELKSKLTGRTHVFRYGDPKPPGYRTELRHYSADGRVLQFEESADGQIKPIAGDITWTVEDRLLVTLNDIQPGNRNRYVMRETREGQIGYYIHAPMTRINGKLSRRTTAIREGEPVVNEASVG